MTTSLKPKTVFDERDQLKRQLAAAEESLAQVQRANAELRAENETLKCRIALSRLDDLNDAGPHEEIEQEESNDASGD